MQVCFLFQCVFMCICMLCTEHRAYLRMHVYMLAATSFCLEPPSWTGSTAAQAKLMHSFMTVSDILAKALGLPARPESPQKDLRTQAQPSSAKETPINTPRSGPGDAATAAPVQTPREGALDAEPEEEPLSFPALDEYGVWGGVPDGQEESSFVLEDWPCDVNCVLALRRACIVPTVVLFLEDGSQGVELKLRSEGMKESGEELQSRDCKLEVCIHIRVRACVCVCA